MKVITDVSTNYRQLASKRYRQLLPVTVKYCLVGTDHNVNVLTLFSLLFPTFCSEKIHLNNFLEK